MKIVYIIKQTKDDKFIATLNEPNLLADAKSQPEINKLHEPLQYFITTAKKLYTPEINKEPAVKIRSSHRFYFIISEQNTYGFITDLKDPELTYDRKLAIFEKIKMASDEKQLQQLIADPDKAIETKMDVAQQKVADVKQQLTITTTEAAAKLNHLKYLEDKSKKIEQSATELHKKSGTLRRSYLPWYSRFFECFTSCIPSIPFISGTTTNPSTTSNTPKTAPKLTSTTVTASAGNASAAAKPANEKTPLLAAAKKI